MPSWATGSDAGVQRRSITNGTADYRPDLWLRRARAPAGSVRVIR